MWPVREAVFYVPRSSPHMTQAARRQRRPRRPSNGGSENEHRYVETADSSSPLETEVIFLTAQAIS